MKTRIKAQIVLIVLGFFFIFLYAFFDSVDFIKDFFAVLFVLAFLLILWMQFYLNEKDKFQVFPTY